VQISGYDDVGCRSKTGTLYHTGFDVSDGWQMTGVSRAMVSICQKVSHPVVNALDLRLKL